MPCRRPAPSILFTAIAATIVALPWAILGTPGDDRDPGPDAPRLIEQPLAGLGGGETVREIHQDTPFSIVALTGNDLDGTSAKVRAKQTDGSWGPWYEAEALDGVAPESDPGRPGTEPVFVGRTNTVQIAVTRPPDAEPTGTGNAGGGADLGYVPAALEQPVTQTINAVLISPPQAPADIPTAPPAAIITPGQPPNIITRGQWGAGAPTRCGGPSYDEGIRAGVVHHTAGSNDYAPQDSAGIIRSIYEYHTRTLGWCDIGYNALVDKYGQVFEGRAGGIDRAVTGSHTGGFNRHTWGVAMLGSFDFEPPTPIQLRTTGRLLGWRLSLDHVDPLGTAVLASAGGGATTVPLGVSPTLPAVFAHRDVGNTECPGAAAYALMDRIRQIAARFTEPPGPEDLADTLRGGAIHARWEAMGGMASPLGGPTSPETLGAAGTRYVTFERGAMYWSPETGAQPLTGAIYATWGSLGFERGILGLPTSAEIHEPLWIVQNFQHGTLNFDRETGRVTRVVDAVALELPAPEPGTHPVQLERFTPAINP
ncbi:N-acetylmuramoyl-L-alanine amidase [Mycolicibacterium thermoresistibile]